MTQSNILTPEKPAGTQEQKISTAFRVAVIMLIAAFTVEAFYLFLAFQMGAWQMYALAGVIAVFCVINIIALPVIKKGHTETGGWLMVIGMLLVFPAASALVANIGIIFGGALIMLTIVVAGQTLPGRQARAAIIAGILVGVLAVIFDYIGLDYRLFVPEIQVFIPAITAIILLVMFIVVIRQSWNKINSSISNRLTALIVVVSIPLLVIVATIISSLAGTRIENTANNALQKTNESLTTNVETWLSFNISHLQEMTLQPDIISMNADQQRTILQAKAQTYPYIYLVSTTNTTGLNVARNDDVSLTDYSDREWFQEVRDGSPIAFQSLIGRTTGNPALVVAVPIRRNGQLAGVGMFATELTDLTEETFVSTIGETGYSYILDSQNKVLAHPELTVVAGELYDLGDYPPVVALDSGQIGLISFIDNDGITWRAYASTTENGWKIITQQQETEILADTRQFREIAFVFIVVGIAAMFALALFTIKRTLQPINSLTETVSLFGSGDFSQMAEIKGQDEVGILASTFNSMAAELRNMIATLEERVADRTRGLQLAAEVGRSVSEARELNILLKDAAEIIRSRFDLYYVQVYLADASKANLLLQAGTGEVGAQLLQRGHRLRLDTGSINGRAAIEQRSVVVADTAASATFRPNPLLPDTRSEMAIPLLLGDRLIGVLNLQSSQPNALNEEKLTAFEALAGQIAVAIQNANLLEQAEQARAEVEAQARRLVRTGWKDYQDAIHRPEQTGFTFEQNQVVPLESKLDLDEQTGALVIPISFTGQQLGSLVVDVDEERQTPQTVELVNIVARQVAQQVENLRLLESAERYRFEAEEATRRLTREGWEEYFSSHARQSLSYLYDLKEVRLYEASATTEQEDALNIPIKIRDEHVGRLAVFGMDTAADPEMLGLLNTVSERLAEHLESLRLLEETQQGQLELNRRAQQLTAVSEISTISSRELDIQKMLATVAHLTQRKFSLYHAHIFTYDEASNALQIIACGWKEGDEHEGTHGTTTINLDQEQSLVARAARTRAPVVVNDVRNEPGWLPNEFLPDTASELAVPLVIGDEILGVLDVQSDQMNAFNDEDVSIQMTLAAQIATALQNARSFARAQRQADREAMLNAISQKIQSATSVEAVLQIAARELGHALGAPRTIAQLSMKDK